MVDTLELYEKADPLEWRLIPMRRGDLLDEIRLIDVPGIMWDAIEKGFFLALRFWKRVKKYGFPSGNWRTATDAQLKVCETFDELWSIVERKRNAKA